MYVDYGDTSCYKSLRDLVLVWDFGQWVLMSNATCYVISTHTTHLSECVPIVKTHQNEHGGGMGIDFQV